MIRLTLLALALMASVTSHGYDRKTGLPFASRSEVIAANGMAATSQPLATQAALDILKAGGSAIDAAIAANAVLGLVEPTGCGIGGDLFAIVWDAEKGELTGLNASGRSPKSLTLDYFKEREMDEVPYLGPLSVSVPGAVDGWFELHGRYGKLPMSKVLAPAIFYAENGFPVTEVIAARLGEQREDAAANSRASRIRSCPTARRRRKGSCSRTRVWRRPTGPWSEGARCVLQGRHRADDRRVHDRERRLHHLRGHGSAHVELGGAGRFELSRS